MRLGLSRIVLRSKLPECLYKKRLYTRCRKCYVHICPIMLSYPIPTCPSYLYPNSQPTPRKYSNQNSRSNTKICQKTRKPPLPRLLFHPPTKPDNRPDPRRNQKISCRVITCICFFCIFMLNYCQHSLEVDAFDSEFPALPSSLAFFFSGGASSFMHAFSRMFVHFPLVPAWLCFRCWRK